MPLRCGSDRRCLHIQYLHVNLHVCDFKNIAPAAAPLGIAALRGGTQCVSLLAASAGSKWRMEGCHQMSVVIL